MRRQPKRHVLRRLRSSARSETAMWAGIAQLNNLQALAALQEVGDDLDWLIMPSRYQRMSASVTERAAEIARAKVA